MVTSRIGDVLVDIRIAEVWLYGTRIVLCRRTMFRPPSDWNPSMCAEPMLRPAGMSQKESSTVTLTPKCEQSGPPWNQTRRALYPSKAMPFMSMDDMTISTSCTSRLAFGATQLSEPVPACTPMAYHDPQVIRLFRMTTLIARTETH